MGNFDGLANANLCVVGIGCIFPNYEGKCTGALFWSTGTTTNNEAELEAPVRGLQLCINKKIVDVNIEGDSHIAINGVTNDSSSNWKLNKWIIIINQCLLKFNDYKISYI
ncbi:hypothetical protein SUGI_1059910 [Cryptomeria japonica]|nr:hypothetical protein SUGI_1059910 [Cryptomeria japonica]